MFFLASHRIAGYNSFMDIDIALGTWGAVGMISIGTAMLIATR